MTRGGYEDDLSLLLVGFCLSFDYVHAECCTPCIDVDFSYLIVSSGRWSSTSAPFVSAVILIHKLFYPAVNRVHHPPTVHVFSHFLARTLARTLARFIFRLYLALTVMLRYLDKYLSIFACLCLLSLIVRLVSNKAGRACGRQPAVPEQLDHSAVHGLFFRRVRLTFIPTLSLLFETHIHISIDIIDIPPLPHHLMQSQIILSSHSIAQLSHRIFLFFTRSALIVALWPISPSYDCTVEVQSVCDALLAGFTSCIMQRGTASSRSHLHLF